MTTTFDQSYISPFPGSAKIHIHKPISSRTAFGEILAIPVRYATNDHARCPKPSGKKSKTGFLGACLVEMEKPSMRRIGTLASVKCDEGTYIFAHPDSGEWYTQIRLHPTPVPFFEPMIISSQRDVDTVMELLKIPERHVDPCKVKEVDEQLWREFREARGKTCVAKERYDSRTWDFEGTLEGMTLFVEKVRFNLSQEDLGS